MMKFRSAIITCIACALFSVNSFADPTTERNLMDFCESYMKRLVSVIKDNDIDYDLYTFGGDILSDFAEEYLVQVTAGDLIVKKENLCISEGSFTLSISSASEEKNAEYAMSFIAAFSALEHESMADSHRSLEDRLVGETQSCYEESRSIFLEVISPALTPDVFERVRNGEEVLLYSGNYDYYLVLYAIDRDDRKYDMYCIKAKEHE